MSRACFFRQSSKGPEIKGQDRTMEEVGASQVFRAPTWAANAGRWMICRPRRLCHFTNVNCLARRLQRRTETA
jgi:hypothetical protein